MANFVFSVAEEITQFSDQAVMRLISQLIKSTSRVLQKLLKYFNGTAILTSFVLLISRALPVFLALKLNDSDFAKVAFASSLEYCQELPDGFE